MHTLTLALIEADRQITFAGESSAACAAQSVRADELARAQAEALTETVAALGSGLQAGTDAVSGITAALLGSVQRELDSALLADRLHEMLLPLEAELVSAVSASGGALAPAALECARALSSAEGRLQLEQQRHAQQVEQLEFENNELRRATRVKSEKIAALRKALVERDVGGASTTARSAAAP